MVKTHPLRRVVALFCSVILSICLSAQVTDLNPFAFKLSSHLEGDVFHVTYYLNAKATNVTVKVKLPSEQIVELNCNNAKNTLGNTLVKGIYHVPISLRDAINTVGELRNQTDLPWTVDVTGGNTASMPAANGTVENILAKNIQLYCPASVDIDADPYSENFGMIYCTEGRTTPTGETPSETYLSHYYNEGKWVAGPGLMVFDAALQNMPPNDENYDFATPKTERTFSRNYNLGMKTKWGAEGGEQGYFNNIYRTVAPRRVRISDDGRIFVTSFSTNGKYLKELNPARLRYDFRNTNGTLKNEGWITEVFLGQLDDNDDDHEFHSKLGPTYLLETTGNKFIAGPNIAFDTHGEGDELRLFAISGDKGSAHNFYRVSIHFDRYKLGTATTWNNKVPNKSDYFQQERSGKIFTNCLGFRTNNRPITFVCSYDAVNAEFDQYGGVWICQFRSDHNEPASLMHIRSGGVINYEEHVMNRSRGGVRYNHDFTKLIVAGGKASRKWVTTNKGDADEEIIDFTLPNAVFNSDKTEVELPCVELRWSTLYDIQHTSNTDVPELSNPIYLNLDIRPDDYAWDYANNLYVASLSDKRLSAYALPNGGKPVSTPSKSTYHFDTPTHMLGIQIYPDNITCGQVVDHEFQKTYRYYMQNATFQLEAIPASGYRFFSWEDATDEQSAITPTITMGTTDIQRRANFGINIWETKEITAITTETTFPGVFVQRQLDNTSYSSICLPFNITTLTGTPYEGASVLRFESTEPSEEEGDKRVFINFEEVTFSGDDYMHAGVPYLIQLPNNINTEKIFLQANCPVIQENQTYNHHGHTHTGNKHGGKSVTHNGITFHGIMKPTDFPASETNLFVTAENQLVTLYQPATINGLRAYFTVSSPMALAEFVIRMPDKLPTNTSNYTINQHSNNNKFIWQGKIYIQKGDKVYNITGQRVK